MAGTRGLSSSPVIRALLEAPHSFDLVQAVRVVEGVARAHAQREEESGPDAGERVQSVHSARFVSDTSLRYPAAAVTRARLRGEGEPVELTISTFGLLGPLGVLPYAYTTHAIERLHDNNEAMRAFMDMFQHRAVTLFCRAGAKYRISLAHEKFRKDRPDFFDIALRSLAGIGSPGMSDRLSVPDDTILHNAGLFSAQNRSLPALEALLANALGLPVHVEPFVGQWVDVPPSEQTALGGGDDGPGQHAQLGASAMLGPRAWVAQDHFRIRIGPMDQAGLLSLMPEQAQAAHVRDLVQVFCGLEFSFDINIVVKAESVPAARLATGDDDARAARLGHMAWVLGAPSPVDRADATFSIGSLG